MYATKEAIIAREHDNSIQPTVFYNDIRAFGKGFDRYFESARNSEFAISRVFLPLLKRMCILTI